MDIFNPTFKGIWIPRFVLEMIISGELNSTDMVLLSVIYAMSKRDEGCYASREYLASVIGKSVGHIKDLISKYRKMGIIIDIEFDGRRQKIKACWDIENPNKSEQIRRQQSEKSDGSSRKFPTAESTSVIPSRERGRKFPTAQQAINNNNRKENRFFLENELESPKAEVGAVPEALADFTSKKKNYKLNKTSSKFGSFNKPSFNRVSITQPETLKPVVKYPTLESVDKEALIQTAKDKHISWPDCLKVWEIVQQKVRGSGAGKWVDMVEMLKTYIDYQIERGAIEKKLSWQEQIYQLTGSWPSEDEKVSEFTDYKE